MDVLLATCAAWPDGEPGAEALDRALAARGIRSRWAQWDDPSVDWSAAALVAVRSVWDYIHRPAELLAWAERVEATSRLLNGAAVFAWNVDKAYLAELGRLGQLPAVPTIALDGRAGLPEAVTSFGGAVVVKPRISASGHGVVVVDGAFDERLAGVADRPVVVQPLVDSVRTEGEHSVFVFDGRAFSRIRKVPAAGEIRAHEERGATVGLTPLDDETRALAERAAATAFGGRPLDYARVDLLRYDGAWCIGELEAIEPGLYLDVHPANAEAYADLLAARLG